MSVCAFLYGYVCAADAIAILAVIVEMNLIEMEKCNLFYTKLIKNERRKLEI